MAIAVSDHHDVGIELPNCDGKRRGRAIPCPAPPVYERDSNPHSSDQQSDALPIELSLHHL